MGHFVALLQHAKHIHLVGAVFGTVTRQPVCKEASIHVCIYWLLEIHIAQSYLRLARTGCVVIQQLLARPCLPLQTRVARMVHAAAVSFCGS